MKNKIISIEEATSKIENGMTVMIGGFLGNGNPHKLIDALVQRCVKDLTIIANDTAMPDVGIGKLVVNKQVKKVITSHIGTNPITGDLMNSGELLVEFVPQGTLAERIRCGGAGLGGCLTKTGLGTSIEEGKQTVTINGEVWLLELPLRANIALLGASTCDNAGNLIFNGTSQNFNPLMATAADIVIAEVDKIVDVGALRPEEIHTPAIFIDWIVSSK